MRKMILRLVKNKFYWIALILTLLTMVPTDRSKIKWNCLAVVLCATLIFLWMEPGPRYLSSCFRENKKRSLSIALFSILHSVTLSRSFYILWIPSNKLAALASRLHLTADRLLLLIILVVFPCMVCTLFLFLSYLLRWYQADKRWIAESAVILYFALMAFQLSQGISCSQLGLLGIKSMVCGALIVTALITLLNAVTARTRLSVLLGTLPFLLFSTITYYVYLFRGREICPHDLLSIGTAMNVVSEYQFSFSPYVLIGWLGWAFLMASLFFTKREAGPRRKTLRAVSVLICLLSVFVVFFLEKDTTVKSWANQGSAKNGTMLNFFLQLRDSKIQVPEGYSPEALQELDRQYRTDEAAEPDRKPSIIVIMNESFTDFSVLGNDVQTDVPLLPFTSALEDNTIRGYVYSSVYGGNTANSEFEFLTGDSMAFLPFGTVPYQQYLSEEQYSLLSYLHTAGYRCIATHPFDAGGWNRPRVYNWFGFDETTFIDDYPESEPVRKYISDRDMYEYVINKYESRNKDEGFFLFGITIQNHGGYTYTNFQSTVPLAYPEHYPEAEQFLTLANLSDQAAEYLIDYFSEVREPVVICFFGDHQPRVESGFLNAVHGGSFDDLNSEMLKYKVPFFIWANYEIEERRDVETSINYLSSYLLEVCGLELPAYNQFLRDAEARIPILTSLGYYSESSGGFLPLSEASGEEKEMLRQYNLLEYWNLFDKTQAGSMFEYHFAQ